jgi:acylaminoacyl-peptidase
MFALVCALVLATPQEALPAPEHFELLDVFELEYAADPRIAPDGRLVVYVRTFFDVMTDRRRSNLWLVDVPQEGAAPLHRPLTSGTDHHGSPRWSPTGDRLLYLSTSEGSTQLFCRHMDGGETASLTRLQESPGNLTWSPDGRWIAFTMHVPAPTKSFAALPPKPEGAQWAEPARVIESVRYRADGEGYVEAGHDHLFVLPADGGTPRRLTSGDFDVEGEPRWSPDGTRLYFSSYRGPDPDYNPRQSEVFELDVATGALRALTERLGPDTNPTPSPDGTRLAYLGYDDQRLATQTADLYVRDLRTGTTRAFPFDRNVDALEWSPAGDGVYVQYDDRGDTTIGWIDLGAAPGQAPVVVARQVGGTSLDRPYDGGSFSVALDGTLAFNTTTPHRPADVAVVRRGEPARRLTDLNADLLGHKALGTVEEFVVPSSHDALPIQGWIVRPPDFDPARSYPLVLEIHGGPFANYGPRFSAQYQLFAAAGYVVVSVNPRGSTSYGQAFAQAIHHDYPSHDYDDLMSAVDHVIGLGSIDTRRLYVTGGSGGGVLTAWIIGTTDRFAAAVVSKPVINWFSFVLTADSYVYFSQYWMPGLPWDELQHYFEHSPIARVGNVKTPTMLLTGEEDYRTPMSESEQYYQALKLLRVDAALVRIPGAGHGIAARPSNLISQVVHILAWFERYGGDQVDGG